MEERCACAYLHLSALSEPPMLRHLPVDDLTVQAEMAGTNVRILHESEAVGSTGTWDLAKETFIPVESRRCFFFIFVATLH
jgi:hypothetical protein